MRTGDVIGNTYQIVKEIGQGGVGVVYLANHLRLGKPVVVKKVKENMVGSIETRWEVDILKKLHHSYLPQVYDFIQEGSKVYTVMEYIKGHDLEEYVKAGYQVEEETILRWLTQLTEVLEYLHSRTPMILHSDIKPGNIMIDNQSNAYLIDFNISLDGESEFDIKGCSVNYAAPEQFQKMKNRRSGFRDEIILNSQMDIFSLGASFYTLMTGQMPSSQHKVIPCAQMQIPYSIGLTSLIDEMMIFDLNKRCENTKIVLKHLSNIRRKSPQYRVKLLLRISMYAILILSIGGIGLGIYYYSFEKSKDSWIVDYNNFVQAVQSYEEETIVSNGVSMLNERANQKYLERNQEKEAIVLREIGNSYFREQDYSTASIYFEKAYKIQKEEEEYLQDYLIALIRSGRIIEADSLMNEHENWDSQVSILIEAEILAESKKYDEALALLDELNSSTNSKVQKEATLLQANIYIEQEQYPNASEILSELSRSTDERDLLRKCGEVSIDAYAQQEGEDSAQKYLEIAISSYERLGSMLHPSYEDQVNLGLAYRIGKDYRRSNELFENMERMYQADYKIKMWQCYNYLDLGRSTNSSDSVLDDLKFVYQDCLKDYKETGKEDSDMEQLILIMEYYVK